MTYRSPYRAPAAVPAFRPATAATVTARRSVNVDRYRAGKAERDRNCCPLEFGFHYGLLPCPFDELPATARIRNPALRVSEVKAVREFILRSQAHVGVSADADFESEISEAG